MAKLRIRNYRQLEDYMGKKIKLALDECANQALDKLTQNIIDSVYDWQPSRYKRSYQLLQAVSRTEVNKVCDRYVVEIFFDYTKMQPIITDNGWNKHADFYGNWINNEQSSADLVNWLEYGTKNRYFSHPEHGFIKDTIEWLNNELNDMFRVYITKVGVPIKR